MSERQVKPSHEPARPSLPEGGGQPVAPRLPDRRDAVRDDIVTWTDGDSGRAGGTDAARRGVPLVPGAGEEGSGGASR